MAIFGQPAATPFDEAAQRTQDQQNAFANIKDNLPALGLIAGLSMLARNNGSRSVGQLIGQAGSDALGAYGTWQKIEQAKARQKMLDDIAAEERQYNRSQDAFQNDMAMRKFGLEEAKMAQDMNVQRQRLAIAQANAALARQNAMAGNWELVGNGMLMDKKTGNMRPLTEEEKAAMQAGGLGGVLYDPKDPGVVKFKEEDAKKAAGEYDALQKAGMAAYDTRAKMDQLDAVLKSGIYTGPGGDMVQSVRRAGAVLGLSDAQAAANGELMTRISNEMALMARNPDSGMGMPGAMSDKDREFLVSMQPGLNNTVEGNRLMVEMSRRIAQRRIDVAAMADQYVERHGRIDSGFYKQIREYSNNNSMFGNLGGQKKERKPLSSFGG